MKFNLMSRAAVSTLTAAAVAATGDDPDAGPAPGQDKPVEAPKPAEPDGGKETTDKPAGDAPTEASTDVILASDARTAIAEADAKGFARANARMATVFASDEGKANPSDAAFLLANSHADAAAIIGQLKSRAGSSAPSAAAADTKPVIPNTNVDLGVDPKALSEEKTAKEEAEAGWDASLTAFSEARSPIVLPTNPGAQGGHVTTPAIPRTGY